MGGIVCILVLPLQALCRYLPVPSCFVLARLFHYLMLRATGFRLKIWGKPSSAARTLFVANHTTYVDIIVIGSLVHAAFVAKKEVASYPLFGWMSKLQKTSFVERRRDCVASQYKDMQSRLLNGESLILFPEGTTSDGRRVLPFRSSLFAAVFPPSEEPVSIYVQPVTIAYTRIDGMPITHALKPLISCYGDMNMARHACTTLGLGYIDVDVIFHQPIEVLPSFNRKQLAKICWECVESGRHDAFYDRQALQRFQFCEEGKADREAEPDSSVTKPPVTRQ